MLDVLLLKLPKRCRAIIRVYGYLQGRIKGGFSTSELLDVSSNNNSIYMKINTPIIYVKICRLVNLSIA